MGIQVAFKVFLLVVVTYNLCIAVKEFLVRKTCNKEIEAVISTVDNKRVMYRFEKDGCIYTIPGNVIYKIKEDIPLGNKVKIKVNDNKTWCCDGEQNVLENIIVVAIGIVAALWGLV